MRESKIERNIRCYFGGGGGGIDAAQQALISVAAAHAQPQERQIGVPSVRQAAATANPLRTWTRQRRGLASTILAGDIGTAKEIASPSLLGGNKPLNTGGAM
jgi:hypothetical protein